MTDEHAYMLIKALNAIELTMARCTAIGIASTLYSTMADMEACAKQILDWIDVDPDQG